MQPSIDAVSLSVFLVLFLLVTVLGFVAARWRKADLNHLNEWGLAGRTFGTFITWFLLGGDLYTAYTFVAVPGLVFLQGAPGFFAVPYTIIAYPIVFVVFPRLWAVAKKHGYITSADFVEGRFQSKSLALAVAFTGILATMPYIALQLVGIQVVLVGLGLTGSGILADLPLIIAFIVLAAYTYTSGLRAPALISVVKDLLIYIAVIAIIIAVPLNLGGFGHIFDLVKQHNQAAVAAGKPPVALMLTPASINQFWTLALGSALALFLYPHAITGVLSSKDGKVVKRNSAFLTAYSLVLGLLALVGFMGIAAGLKVDPTVNGIALTNGAYHIQTSNYMMPALILQQFPNWFQGVAFAGITIGALVPAAIMSIAASNLFTRNIYKAYFRPNVSNAEEASVAKLVSLIVKFGALLFILLIPTSNAINFQLLGGVWIMQTLPPVIIGLYTRFLHRYALLLGWLVGMVAGTWMVISASAGAQGLISAFTIKNSSGKALTFMGNNVTFYVGLGALVLNLVVAVVFSLIFNVARIPNGQDATSPGDYTESNTAVEAPSAVALAEE
jgi:SSS family solute:Na+ symporter